MVVTGSVAKVLALSELLHLFVMFLLEAQLLLNLVASDGENKDATNLEGNVAPRAKAVVGEESDGGGNHVGAKERGGVNNELIIVVVGVVAKHNSTGDLEDVLGVGRYTEKGEECVGNGSTISTNTSAEETGVEVVHVPATQ